MMNRSQLTHAPYVQRPPAIVQLKKSRVVEWLPCDASTIENLDQDPGQLSTDCIRGRQTSFNVSHLLLLCEKGVIAAGEHLGTCWWYKSKM